MKPLRMAALCLAALVLAWGIQGCAKKSEQELTIGGEDTTFAGDTLAEMTPPAYTEPPSSGASPPGRASAGATTPRSGTRTPRSGTPAEPASGRTVSLPAGATFDAEMVTPINTKTSNVGERIEAKLLQPLTSPDGGGAVIAERGASVWGEITELRRASRAKSEEERAMVKMQFTSIETVAGEKALSATVTNSEGRMIAGSTTKRDALIIGGSAVAGAVLGRVVGKDTKATVIGAIGGAVLGTGAVMAAKGYELDIPAGSRITLRAEAPVTIVAR